MEVSADMLKRGQAFYRGKDYKAALRCFTIVINNEDVSLLTALDNRAVTYVQLGDLLSALRDAKRMIQLDKCSSMGYLRASKILQLSEKAEVALRICEYGLLNVSSEDSNYGVSLLKSRSKMLIMASKPVDPVAVLPVELVLNIMLYLDFKTVLRLLRISRSWHSMLVSFPPLWRKLDFSGTVKSIPMNTALEYAKRAKCTTSHARFHIKKPNDVVVMGAFMSRCKVLQCVEVTANNTYDAFQMESCLIRSADHLVNLKTLTLPFSCAVLLNTVSRLLGKCRSLKRAEFNSVRCEKFIANWTDWIEGDVTNIRTLSFRYGGQQRSNTGTILNLAALLVKMPKIQSLALTGWSWSSDTVLSHTDFTNLSELQELSMLRNSGLVFPRLPTSLQTLVLWHCTTDRRLSQQSNDNLMSNRLPELADLVLAEFTDLKLNELLSLLSASKGKLKTLDIESCVRLETEHINTLVKTGYLEEVTRLTLRQLTISDSTAELVAQNLAYLKFIDLSLTRVTGIGVKALVLKPHSSLEHLALTGLCLSRDVIVFATAHGITVDHGNRSKELMSLESVTKYLL